MYHKHIIGQTLDQGIHESTVHRITGLSHVLSGLTKMERVAIS